MDDSMEIYRVVEALARRELAAGRTASYWEAHAAEQRKTGFSASADFTSLVATIMKRLSENGHEK